MAAITRYIKIGKRTEGHAELLKSKGYEVEEQDGMLAITASKVIKGTVDLSTREKAQESLATAVAEKAVFSYKTKFLFPDGKELYGVMACTRLGKASALVTKGLVGHVSKAIGDIFAAL